MDFLMGQSMVLVFIAVSVFWLLLLTLGLKKLYSQRCRVARAIKEENLMDTLVHCLEELQLIRKELQRFESDQQKMRSVLKGTVQKVGVVRFDAFEDVGGKLSFSVALLNEHGDGIVLSSLNGRQESRSYVKPVEGGESSYTLSKEEREAIAKALE